MVLKTIKSITSETFGNFIGGNRSSVTGAGDAYNKVPIVRRAVDMVADACSTVPMGIYDTADNRRDWEDIFITPINEIMRRASQMIDVFGFVVIEKVKTSSGRRVVDLRVLNSANISIMYMGHTAGVPMLRFMQSGQGAETTTFTSDEVIYVAEFNPIDDILPGRSRVQVAIESARLMHYQTAYAASFFEKGAMNTLNVSVPPSMKEDERNKLKALLNRMYAGVMNGVGRYMVLSNNIDVQVVSQPIKDLTVPELANYARREVALALGVPQTMLEDTSNRASREQDTKTFWDTTVKMRVNGISSAVTRQFLQEAGLELYADWERMEIFQEDEVERTGSLLQLVTAGVPLQVAVYILGYELSDEHMAMLSASTEPRLPMTSRMQIEGARFSVPTPAAYQRGQEETITSKAIKSAVVDELGAWRNFALKRFGKDSRPFEAQHIDATLQISLKNALKSAETLDDVHRVFDDALSYVGVSDSQ